MFKGLSKEEKSWIMFDWADSAYTMTVMTVVFSMYWLHAADNIGVDNSAGIFAFTSSFITIVAGIMAPILGTLSGFQGKKKVLFNFFTFLGIASTAALAFIPYTYWWLLLTVFVISGVGFNACNKIYDAFLVDVSEIKNMDRVSTLGFGMGYVGGGLGFVMSILVLIFVMFGLLDLDLTRAYQISFGVTAIWWLVFSIPMFKNVRQNIGEPAAKGYVKKSFVNIWTTLKEMAKNKPILLFLIAFFLYSDGVGSIIRMAVVFGSDIGINDLTLLAVLLAVQFVAFPFAVLYGVMARKFGAKRTIYFGILTYCIICFVGLLMTPERDMQFLTILFWTLAMLVATAQGGIQALSRSYFGRIIPKNKANEYFGIYNIFGRFASMIGTFMFGVVATATGRPHLGIGVIVLLFVAAAIIFAFVPDDRQIN